MEEKQLNFDQPLLSVRKTNDNSFARLPPFHPHKSELKSGSLRNAGAVPFVWEKAPGRPKHETKLQTHAKIEQPHFTPNLPPGRVFRIKQQDSDVVSKDAIISTFFNSQNGVSLDEKEVKDEGLTEGIEEKESSDSDDGDETFLDALDTLSRTESFFMSCRMNGWDDDQEEQVQKSGSFLSDQRAHDFMIDRFLPAAKAMTYETTSVQGQQKQLKKVLSTEKCPPLIQHKPKSLRHFIQEIGSEGSDDENDDDVNYPTTGCGLFPRLRLLNPVPGLKMEDKAKLTSYNETYKEHARPSCHGKMSVDSNSEFTKEKATLGILNKFKHVCESTDPNQTSCASPVEKTLYVDSEQKVKSQTNDTDFYDDSEALERDSGIYRKLSIDSSLEDSGCLELINVKAALQAKISKSLDSPFLVWSKHSSNGFQMEVTNHSKKMDSEKLGNQESDLNQDLVMTSSPKVVGCENVDLENQVSSNDKTSSGIDQKRTLASTMVEDDGRIDLESQCVLNLRQQDLSDATSYFEIPLVLPSLKAPSDSWLKKTLPTIFSKKCDIKARSQIPKWETIVKSSNEEILKPIAED